MVRLVLVLSGRLNMWCVKRHQDMTHYGWGGGAWTGKTPWSVQITCTRAMI